MITPARRAFFPFALLLAFAGIAAADVNSVANPSAPDSLAPRLVTGANGVVLMSWLEPVGSGHALRHSSWRDGHWRDARTVAAGTNWFVNWADFPAIVPQDESFWTAHWLVRRPAGGYAYDIHVAVTRDSGQSWSEPRVLHADGTDTEHGFAVHYPQPHGAGIAWLDGRNMLASGGGMTLRTAVLTPQAEVVGNRELDGLVCDCCQTDAAPLPGGTVVVYRDRTSEEIRDIYAIRQQDGHWLPPVRVAADGWRISSCPVNGPAVASRGDDVAVAWFSASGGRPRVQLARSVNAAAGFEPPLIISEDRVLGRVRVLMLPDGSLVVSYLQAAGAGTAALHLRHVDRDGKLAPPHVVARDVRPFSVPQLAHAGDDLLIAWSGIDGEHAFVRTGVLSLDALATGIADGAAAVGALTRPGQRQTPR